MVHAAGAVVGAAWVLLAWFARREEPVPLSALFACLAIAWAGLFAVRSLLPVAEGARAWIRPILAWAVFFRVVGFFAPPVLEDDHFRFLWDGYVFAEHGSPYGRAPAAWFGDPHVPGEMQRVLNGVNHPQVPTIYGPVCQFVFLASHAVAPAQLWPLKLVLIGAELGALFLWRRRLEVSGLLGWAWCPLLVQETAFSAHPDALGLGLAVGAMTTFTAQRPIATGALLALAVAARPFAALLAPFLLWPDWRRAVPAFGMSLAAVYAPFLFGPHGADGPGLGAFARDWEFNSSLFALLRPLFGGTGARLAGAVLLGGVMAVLWWRWHRQDGASRRLLPAGERIYAALLVVSPVANPWYFQWLVPFVARRPEAWSVALLASVALSYATGANLGSPSVAGFNHPPWVRPVEFGLPVLAGLTALTYQKLRLRTGSRTNRR